MTDKVPADQIETIVGVRRHATAHFGRAVSSMHAFYILHSEQCRSEYDDLRYCPYSKALDRGIDPGDWVEDEPVCLQIENGWLMPDDESPTLVQAAEANARHENDEESNRE